MTVIVFFRAYLDTIQMTLGHLFSLHASKLFTEGCFMIRLSFIFCNLSRAAHVKNVLQVAFSLLDTFVQRFFLTNSQNTAN